MFRIPLPSEESFLLLVPRFGDVTGGWQWVFLGIFLLVPMGLVVWLYRYELLLISKAIAGFLLLLRLFVLLILWFVVGLQPTVARYHEEEQPSRVLVAVDLSPSMEVRDPQRSQAEKESLAAALDLGPTWAPAHVDALTRLGIVQTILGDRNWLGRLRNNHQVELIGFDKNSFVLESVFDLKTRKDGGATDLRQPLLRALEPSGKGKLLGLVVFTDGQHNTGSSPLAKAKELAEGRIPVYPVAIGAKDAPADIAVLEVKAPANAFKDSDVPVEARIRITGVPAGHIEVELVQPGKPSPPDRKKIIAHDGKVRVVPVRFQVKMEDLGTHTLEVKAQALSKDVREITTENNVKAAVVRVGQDKARVLLIDGEARWEYHYLANVLRRDPTVQPDLVVFSQPRLGKLPEDQLEKLGHARVTFPEFKADGKSEDLLYRYDCILLGDIPTANLPLEDRRRLERYVAERGGTLLLLAGKHYFPAEYLAGPKAGDDPLLKMLPITEPRPVQPEEGFPLFLTAEGNLTPFLQIEPAPEANLERWAGFPKHYWGLVGKPKPGAAALAFAGKMPGQPETKESLEKTQATIIRHNYGFGRVVLIGIDSTWRWRYKIGDTYHHRFWGQLVRWAAADKLLPGGNRHVRFGSRAPVVRPGQAADIVVRLGEALPPLSPEAKADIRLWRQLPEGKEEQAALVPLKKNANQAKLLEAQVHDLPAGQYRIEPAIPEVRAKLAEPPDPDEKKVARRDTFTVLPPEEGEMYDLATNWPLLQGIAEASQGKLYTVENVEELVSLFAHQVVKKEEREEQRLWQDEPLVWWTFAILIGLLTLEWVGRKWAGLP